MAVFDNKSTEECLQILHDYSSDKDNTYIVYDMCRRTDLLPFLSDIVSLYYYKEHTPYELMEHLLDGWSDWLKRAHTMEMKEDVRMVMEWLQDRIGEEPLEEEDQYKVLDFFYS